MNTRSSLYSCFLTLNPSHTLKSIENLVSEFVGWKGIITTILNGKIMFKTYSHNMNMTSEQHKIWNVDQILSVIKFSSHETRGTLLLYSLFFIYLNFLSSSKYLECCHCTPLEFLHNYNILDIFMKIENSNKWKIGCVKVSAPLEFLHLNNGCIWDRTILTSASMNRDSIASLK